jgi:hypothetical protein
LVGNFFLLKVKYALGLSNQLILISAGLDMRQARSIPRYILDKYVPEKGCPKFLKDLPRACFIVVPYPR